MKKLLLIFSACFLYNAVIHGQLLSKESGQNKFAIYGNAEAVYVSNKEQKSFTDINFKPIFLWKISDKLFVEAETEIETGDGVVNFGLEYANMNYIVNQYLILHAGRFLPKFGAYRGRFAEGFLNRFASNPAGFGDGGIGASVETGFGALGSLPFGDVKVLYDVYVVNGPHLLTDSANQGQFDYEAYTSNNNDQAYGGRLAILPLSNSSLEVGFSLQHKAKTGDLGTIDEKVSLDMQAVDLNYYTSIQPIKSTLRIIGEFRHQKVGNNAVYTKPDGTDFSFTNSPSCYYAMGSLRPSLLENKFLRNIEVAVRSSYFKRPVNAPWGGSNIRSTEIALDYWLNWNSLLKISYQNRSDALNTVYAQVVFGF
ncbi:hypothetical protein [Segetibacter koreensis]|uniref:hypothetical protein n=1 Tax=Segetibacter koreensis TaxID=398037 RepID=UPI0003716B29|nr:hypothetical protein [Segetibacter koreensis]